VRVTHLPTGLQAESHHRHWLGANRKLALGQLAGLLFVLAEVTCLAESERLHDDRGEVRPDRPARTIVLGPGGKAHDLWIGAEMADTDAVLDGDIGLFLEAERKHGSPIPQGP
jgi:peptide chain release factor 2